MSEKDEQIKQAQIDQKIRELTEIGRIVQNTINLVEDMEIKGAVASAVVEILQYNKDFKSKVEKGITELRAQLPKKDEGVQVPAISPLSTEVK